MVITRTPFVTYMSYCSITFSNSFYSCSGTSALVLYNHIWYTYLGPLSVETRPAMHMSEKFRRAELAATSHRVRGARPSRRHASLLSDGGNSRHSGLIRGGSASRGGGGVRA